MIAAPVRTRIRAVVLIGALLVVGGCAENTGPDYTPPAPYHPPARTSEPTTGSFHVVLTTTGANPDPDGYMVTVDDSDVTKARVNDTVLVAHVRLDRHVLRLDDVATNCVVDSALSRTFFLTSARDTVIDVTVGCVAPSIPSQLAGMEMLFVRAGQIYRGVIGRSAAPVALGAGEEPAWSPDGQRIAFLRDGDVYVMDASGANERLVATGLPPDPWGNPKNGFVLETIDGGRHAVAWSPDGSQLALYSNALIVIAPVDGAAPVQLIGAYGSVSYGSLSGSPAWSPDGKRVAFVNDSGMDTELDVFIGDVSGSGLSNVRKLTDAVSSGAMYIQPAWSPDGSRIAMVACSLPVTDGGGPCPGSRIMVMNADGTQPHTLSFAKGYGKPVWSPDGQMIVFSNACGEYRCSSAVLYVSVDGTRKGMLLDDAHSLILRQ